MKNLLRYAITMTMTLLISTNIYAAEMTQFEKHTTITNVRGKISVGKVKVANVKVNNYKKYTSTDDMYYDLAKSMKSIVDVVGELTNPKPIVDGSRELCISNGVKIPSELLTDSEIRLINKAESGEKLTTDELIEYAKLTGTTNKLRSLITDTKIKDRQFNLANALLSKMFGKNYGFILIEH